MGESKTLPHTDSHKKNGKKCIEIKLKKEATGRSVTLQNEI
jgi:hypothetical protein